MNAILRRIWRSLSPATAFGLLAAAGPLAHGSCLWMVPGSPPRSASHVGQPGDSRLTKPTRPDLPRTPECSHGNSTVLNEHLFERQSPGQTSQAQDSSVPPPLRVWEGHDAWCHGRWGTAGSLSSGQAAESKRSIPSSIAKASPEIESAACWLPIFTTQRSGDGQDEIDWLGAIGGARQAAGRGHRVRDLHAAFPHCHPTQAERLILGFWIP
jgi:hypothetical protein